MRLNEPVVPPGGEMKVEKADLIHAGILLCGQKCFQCFDNVYTFWGIEKTNDVSFDCCSWTQSVI